MRYLLIILLLFFGCDDPASPQIEGCTDASACNYNDTANYDDGTCISPDECGVCGGDGVDADDDNICDDVDDCIDTDLDNICDDIDDCIGYNNEGYHCNDLDVLQDFIDLNSSLDNLTPVQLSTHFNGLIGPYLGQCDWEIWKVVEYIDHPTNNNLDMQAKRLANLCITEAEIENIPNSISDLNILESLSLKSNNIQNLANFFNSIKDLNSLEVLNLSDNNIENIPIEIEELYNLKELLLDNNNIVNIPEQLSNLNLIILSLSGNPINLNSVEQIFSMDIGTNMWYSCERLYLSNCGISNIEESFLYPFTWSISPMMWFDFSYNQITELPENILDLACLEECGWNSGCFLHFQNNQINNFSEFYFLPYCTSCNIKFENNNHSCNFENCEYYNSHCGNNCTSNCF